MSSSSCMVLGRLEYLNNYRIQTAEPVGVRFHIMSTLICKILLCTLLRIHYFACPEVESPDWASRLLLASRQLRTFTSKTTPQ